MTELCEAIELEALLSMWRERRQRSPNAIFGDGSAARWGDRAEREALVLVLARITDGCRARSQPC